jgi:hypothetical protein
MWENLLPTVWSHSIPGTWLIHACVTQDVTQSYVRESTSNSVCVFDPWDMAHPYVGHVSFICVTPGTWLTHMWDITYETWLIYMWVNQLLRGTLIEFLGYDSFICVTPGTWLICETWLIHVWVNQLLVGALIQFRGYDSFIYVTPGTWLICETWLIHMWVNQLLMGALTQFLGHDSFMCVIPSTWLIHMWESLLFISARPLDSWS